jgi:predicted lipase
MTPAVYNSKEAHRAALLSDYAYGDETEAPRAALNIGASDAALVEAGGTEVLVAKFGADVWISFRGTTDLPDWMANVSLTFKTSSGVPGRAHSGFADSSLMALADVLDAVHQLRGSDGRIYLTGHSKGGAETILTAARLFDAGIEIGAVHVFGAPAVGDREFADAYGRGLGAITFRHVFASDFVARSPFFFRLTGSYHDVGNLVYHTRSGLRTFRPSPLRRFVDCVRAFSRKLGAADHSIDNYIEGTE